MSEILIALQCQCVVDFKGIRRTYGVVGYIVRGHRDELSIWPRVIALKPWRDDERQDFVTS